MASPVPVPTCRRQRLLAAASIASKSERGHELDTLHQCGGAKIRLPRSEATALSAVMLNTAGGLTGDDEIRWHATAGARSRLTVASAASEKVYRTHGPSARQRTSLTVAAGARLDWLPQETILFDGSRLERTLHATLDPDATLLVAEAIAFGRRASGESLRTVSVRDNWRVYRGDTLLHAESFRLDETRGAAERTEDIGGAARSRGTLHGVGAMATVLYCSPEDGTALDRLGDALRSLVDAAAVPGAGANGAERDSPRTGAIGGVSAMAGRVVLRLVAPSSFELRRILLPCLARLQGDAPLPRVWHV